MHVNSTMDDSRAVALRGREVKAGLAEVKEATLDFFKPQSR